MSARHPLFRDAYCDGHGTMVCHCGGDLCVCGLDGEDCFGCEKCDRDPEPFFEPDDELHQP